MLEMLVDRTRGFGPQFAVIPRILLRRKRFLVGVAFFSLLSLFFIVPTISNVGSIACDYEDPCSDTYIMTSEEKRNLSLNFCPLCNHLSGPIDTDYEPVTFLSKLEKDLEWVKAGGRFKPQHCVSRQRIAIVVPYRDREEHLKVFLKNIHPFLRNQSLDYGIFIVEQSEGSLFNRGTLLNIGFQEALKQDGYDCFIFHDVDYLPLDLRNTYACSNNPKHMSVIVDTYDNKLPYQAFFGGVAAMTVDQFRSINGFPNRYWGWGGEDDDIVERFKQKEYSIVRHFKSIAKYTMLEHTRDKGNPINPKRYEHLYKAQVLYKTDGLSDLSYKVLKLEKKPLFTRVYVDLENP